MQAASALLQPGVHVDLAGGFAPPSTQALGSAR
jgi:hypothetical protein